MSSNPAATAMNEPALADLGPLAWVLDELRKSLDGATKAMRRFVRDAELARGSDLSELDASHLRIARQQLHQAVGALEMVGLVAPAKVLRGMEALAQKFVQRPELCSEDAAARLERASFALTEYLEGVLKGKNASAVALFPQYRGVMELASGERVHPADLWPVQWRWQPVEPGTQVAPRAYDAELRSRMDQAVLKIVKTGDKQSAQRMAHWCNGLAAGLSAFEPRCFWLIAAGFFEAKALGLLPEDVYTKRTASRILQQYASLAKGEPEVSDRLAQDLVFFCWVAVPEEGQAAPALNAVRQAYGFENTRTIDYETEQFGRFDPALLVLARKRIAAAAETWSALAGGDTNRLKMAAEQFSAITDSMVKLHPESLPLARALNGAIDATVRSGAAPVPAVAMEVATTVLYLEAAYEDLDPTDSHMVERGARLAQRLQNVAAGGESESMESWMEELYRRVSDRQTMGSVVDELRTSLGEVENSLDQFFRDPSDKTPLREVPSQLSQMRGVFSVLGLEQPALATLRMRGNVEKLLIDDVDADAARTGIFEKLGNSLGALGFLIDMLSYQRALAKKLFVYDEELSEFRPVMGRERSVAPEQTPRSMPDPVVEVAEPQPVTSTSAQGAVPAEQGDEDDAELLEIFLDEAREVVQNGQTALQALEQDRSNLADQTTLRRAFHTLKGSSRMVGLNEFGEAAWSFEQLLNAWLAEQRPASEDLIALAGSAMTALGHWVEDIAAHAEVAWNASDFRHSSDALRLHGTMVPLRTPGELAVAVPEEEPQVGMLEETAEEDVQADFAATEMFDLPELQTHEAVQEAVPTQLMSNLDFGLEPPPAFEATQLASSLDAEPEVALPDFQSTQLFDFEPTRTLEAGEVRDGVARERDLLADVDLGDFDFGTQAAEQTAAPLEEAQGATEPEEEVQEQVKVIGSLRLSIPLYNVYLNEADEWSRRLQIELSEWTLELHRPVPDAAVSLAHSLAGSSATVGFSALSDIARALEHALQHVQLHAQGEAVHALVFNNAAEDIRRLLHQFAAGFLKEPDTSVLEALQAITETEFVAPEHEVEPDAEPVSESRFMEDMETQSPVVVADFAPSRFAGDFQPSALAPLVPAPLKVVDARDEDIDAVDRLDPDLLSIFEEEAQELLPALGTALRQWVARPDNLSARGEVLRVLHTLKGSARLAGAMRLGEMAHRMESSIEQIGNENLQAVQLEPLLSRFDGLQSNFESLGKEQPVAQEPAVPQVVASSAKPVISSSIGTESAAPIPVRVAANQSVRVKSLLLDRLVNQAGEVMISRSRMESRLGQLRASLQELDGNLDRLRQQLRDVELQAESQMQSRLAQTKDAAQGFDPLEFDRFTRVQELTRMMAESVNDVATVQRSLQRTVQGTEDDLIAQGRQARELQRDLLRTRMVEFEGISDRLYGVVRQAAKEAGKQVKLDIVGGSIEMDRGVLDRMTPAFEHMLRNAVVHGIEGNAERAASSKPAVGTITITVEQESNDVAVAFSDDGGGLHLEKIRAKAVANGLVDASVKLSEAQAADLLFTPGFTTADHITELAGRGIGMDVVRSEVNALGGRIETSSEKGAGTTFKLVLPLTTAVTQVVMLRMGEFTIGVPASLMETVLRIPSAALEKAYADDAYVVAGQSVPFFWAGALLQISSRSLEPIAKTAQVALFRSAGQRLAMHVDEVLGNREVVVKNLGPQLARLPGLAGMSVLASGSVVLIYNPVALATVYGEQARLLHRASASASQAGVVATLSGAEQVPLVLVVDDSITVRRVTQRLLKREGYRVALANDGLQALERLQEEKPSVVLSDIEMPRMDGFDLVRNIRSDDKLRDLPIIMITSRIAEKHREHAKELGVDHYLGKPYSEEQLLELVRSYCATAVES
ncbi:MAG: Hpt domain-containing protein [Burkholderiales bacterium]|nr:Hpt domain-containing protein [Burkholderiales bacterium]